MCVCLRVHVCVCVLVCGNKLICRQHHITGSKLICIQHCITLDCNKCFSESRQWQTFIENFFIFINSVRHQRPVCQREVGGNERERERERNSNSATLSVLLNPNFPAVWKENFSLSFPYSDYHHRFLKVSNIAFFFIVFALFIVL